MITLPEELIFKPYQKYPTLKLQEAVDNWTIEQLEEWDTQYKETIKYNQDITSYNSNIEKNWIIIFNKNGAKIKSIKGSKLGWYKESLNAIGKPPPNYIPSFTSPSIKIGEKYYYSHDLVNVSPTTLKDLVIAARKKIDEIARTKHEEKALQVKLLKLAEEYNISPSNYDYSIEMFYDAIKEEHKNRWILANYPDGKELRLKCCDECNTWVVGEHRCSCGNRRVYLEVEGDVLEGYIAYPCCY